VTIGSGDTWMRPADLDRKAQGLRDCRAGALQAAPKLLTTARDQTNADRLRTINASTLAL
jgi:hypothetical protein